MATLNVLVSGARGRMGQETVRAIRAEDGLELVGETDLGDDLTAAIRDTAAAVVVDFTTPQSAVDNTRLILAAGACPVVGTTGFRPEDIEALEAESVRLARGGLIAPNFAIGAVLLMRFAAQAVRFFPDVEVIEMHHERKVDAPSGTALKTIEMMHAARQDATGAPPRAERPQETETVAGARGGTYLGVPVHSIRLPGYVAHQEVQFGAPGQVLTLRHDAPSRSSFMPGVILAVRRVVELDRLHYGLETILDV